MSTGSAFAKSASKGAMFSSMTSASVVLVMTISPLTVCKNPLPSVASST